ncbi:MAG: flagellar biosynthesis protein FlgD [Lentisphaeria bacterium]|nr:flagellar biosynthesis protein FlgD [Lentisphaeria bacterium]
MEIQAIDGSMTGPTALATQADEVLSKTDFLKLLVAQMKNQDPMDPVSNTEYVAQLTSFSSLEQLQNLNKTITEMTASNQLGSGAGLIGKHVTLFSGGVSAEGSVDKVRVLEGKLEVFVNDSWYNSAAIETVAGQDNETNTEVIK